MKQFRPYLFFLFLTLCSCKTKKIDEKYAAAVVKDELSLPGDVFALDLKGGYSGAQLFAVTSESKKYVARFITHKSQEDCNLEIYNLKVASDAGYGPQVYFTDTSRGIVIMEYLSGTKVSPQDLQSNQFYVELANLLRNIHHGHAFKNSGYDVFKRINNDIQKNEPTCSIDVPLTKLSAVVAAIHQALLSHLETTIPCHNDLHSGNLIFLGSKFKVIDYEDAGLGDPYFDVATIISSFHCDQIYENILFTTYLGRRPSEIEIAKLYLMKQIVLIKWAFDSLNRISPEITHKYGSIQPMSYVEIEKEHLAHKLDLSKPEDNLKVLKSLFSQVLDNFESQEFKDAVKVLRGSDEN